MLKLGGEYYSHSGQESNNRFTKLNQQFGDMFGESNTNLKSRLDAERKVRDRILAGKSGKYDIDIPDWLQERADMGYTGQRKREMFTSEAVPLSRKALTGQRRGRAQLAQTGLKGGFQDSAIEGMEMERQDALSQLQVGIDNQSEAEKEQGIERLKNIDSFNKRMRESYELYGEEHSLDLQQMQQNYQMQLEQMKAQEDANRGSLGGALLGYGLNMVTGVFGGEIYNYLK